MRQTTTRTETPAAVACALLMAASAADAAPQPMSGHASDPAIRLAQATTSFNLPAQPLADSLRAVAGQTNSNILFDRRLVQGLTAKPLQAELSVVDALTELLEGTELVFRSVDDRTVMIVPRQERTSQTGTPEKAGRLRLAQNDSSGTANDATDGSQSISAGERAANSPLALEEIIVTATKRAESTMKISESIAVITAESIANRGLVSADQYFRSVPGIAYTDLGPGQNTVHIRGVVSSPFSAGATVGQYFGEVPLTGLALGSSVDVKLIDMQRVEVLRGPQGTLYGSN